MTARRVTVFRDSAGGWRYRVQAGNWRVIEASEESFSQKRTVLNRVAKKYPRVELVIE